MTLSNLLKNKKFKLGKNIVDEVLPTIDENKELKKVLHFIKFEKKHIKDIKNAKAYLMSNNVFDKPRQVIENDKHILFKFTGTKEIKSFITDNKEGIKTIWGELK